MDIIFYDCFKENYACKNIFIKYFFYQKIIEIFQGYFNSYARDVYNSNQ